MRPRSRFPDYPESLPLAGVGFPDVPKRLLTPVKRLREDIET